MASEQGENRKKTRAHCGKIQFLFKNQVLNKRHFWRENSNSNVGVDFIKIESLDKNWDFTSVCCTGQSSFHALTLQSNAKLEKVEQQRSDETDVVTDKNLAFGW